MSTRFLGYSKNKKQVIKIQEIYMYTHVNTGFFHEYHFVYNDKCDSLKPSDAYMPQ